MVTANYKRSAIAGGESYARNRVQWHRRGEVEASKELAVVVAEVRGRVLPTAPGVLARQHESRELVKIPNRVERRAVLTAPSRFECSPALLHAGYRESVNVVRLVPARSDRGQTVSLPLIQGREEVFEFRVGLIMPVGDHRAVWNRRSSGGGLGAAGPVRRIYRLARCEGHVAPQHHGDVVLLGDIAK